LLVLLPGETNAPGSATGTTGTAAATPAPTSAFVLNATDAYFTL